MNIHNIPDPALDGALQQNCMTNKPIGKTKPVMTPVPAAATVNVKPAKPAQSPLPAQTAAKAWRGPWWKN